MATTMSRRAVLGGVAASAVATRAQAAYATTTNPADLGILDAASLLHTGKLSSHELTAACQQRIATRNGPVTFDGADGVINAWIRLYPDLAATLSAAADQRLAAARKSGSPAPLLCGVPLGLKDLYAVAGKPVTASSRVLDGSSGLFPVNVATGDSTVWALLKAAGMVLLGHTHTHEFAAGSATPQTGNPWDPTHIPGGSSGGSAAALAARMIPAATGSDTGGSLRMPSGCCGTSTIKGTYGLVSTHGVIPLQWSYDHAGPMARSLDDVALMLTTMAAADADDGGSLAPVRHAPYPTTPRAGPKPLSGTRIGVNTAPGTLSTGVAAVFERFQGELVALGATLVKVDPPDDPLGADLQASIATLSEIDAFHRPFFPERASLYRPAIAQTLAAAREANTPAYDLIRMQQLRRDYQQAWNATFAQHDIAALIMPTNGSEAQARNAVDDLTIVTRTGANGLTNLWDETGFPVACTPAGPSPTNGLPVGMQIVGTAWTEATLLQIGIDYQAHHPYWALVPPGLPA
jgi:aspartyl-tRNA(Asn)/glutamyl-tRNA(Gln) amidotransferase subunit A